MKTTAYVSLAALALAMSITGTQPTAQGKAPEGFVSIFNGKDLTGWKIPEGDGGHWKVVDGVIDYDAGSLASTDKNLWTEKSYKNFQLKIDWRIKETPFISKNMKIVMPDGRNKRDAKGDEINLTAPDSDSGLLPRGSGRAQFNIWCWPVGSGEMYGYRTDPKTPPALKAAVTPRMNADNDIGQWNTFELTVQGSDVTLLLNGKTVIPKVTLPDLPAEGPIGLQHHGGRTPDGGYSGIPALVQFRNIYVKELP
jgi:3-keto-disaccharide hydrolase